MTTEMKVTMLLCDAAQEANGKLYILGGGWSVTRQRPVTMALAIKILVPWDGANQKHAFKLELVTEDDLLPTLERPDGSFEPQEIQAAGEFEAGRPPGLTPGVPLDTHLAMTFGGVPLRPARYVWRFEVDERRLAEIPFSVLPPS